MLKYFYELLYGISDLTNGLLSIGSIITGVITIIMQFRSLWKKKKVSWMACFLLGVCIMVVLTTLVRKNLTKVPYILEHTYQDACIQLADNGLTYNAVYDDENVYIIRQFPEAGTIVKKGTCVELEVISALKYNAPVGEGKISFTFREHKIYIKTRDGVNLETIGRKIDNIVIKSVYLESVEDGYIYDDFYIDGQQLKIDNIPVGINYNVHMALEGYKEYDVNMMLSSQNMDDGVMELEWLIPREKPMQFYTVTFFVADADNSNADNIMYIPNLELYIQWPYRDEKYLDAWSGNYGTDENGEFSNNIWINEKQEINVKILDPYRNGYDYECSLALEKNDKKIIFIKRDGTCTVKTEEEYYAK